MKSIKGKIQEAIARLGDQPTDPAGSAQWEQNAYLAMASTVLREESMPIAERIRQAIALIDKVIFA